MEKSSSVRLIDAVLSLSAALDLVSPAVASHHKRVACITLALARKLNLPAEERHYLTLAAAIHDCGAFSLKERLDILSFDLPDGDAHAETGYRLLRDAGILAPLAPLVRYHHVRWDDGRGAVADGEAVPRGSHLLHLADRVAVLITETGDIYRHGLVIQERIAERIGTWFVPEHVEAFTSLAERECFWLDTTSPCYDTILLNSSPRGEARLAPEETEALCRLFYHVTDFRSPYTATHTCGVAACAHALAAACGLSEADQRDVRIAAGLHDLGKLAVPREILEKRERLSHLEQVILRGHPYFGFRILERIPGLAKINRWANYHHERLDGTGYPFHVTARRLPLGSRIVAAADIFAALTEDRPYRPGIGGRAAMRVMEPLAREGALDPEIVSIMQRDAGALDDVRREAQAEAAARYRSLDAPAEVPGHA